jgi:RHS repeat-associated protein
MEVNMKAVSQKFICSILIFTLMVSTFPMGNGVQAEGNNPKNTESETINSKKEEQNQELIAPDTDVDYLPVEDITGEDVIVTEGREKGTYELTAFDDAVKVKQPDGTTVPLNPNLTRTEDGYSPKATNLPLVFDDSIQSDSPFVKIGQEGSTVAFTLKGLRYNNEILTPKETPTITNENQVWHKGVFPNVDLRHITLNDEVKEDIIFYEQSALPQEVIYEFKTELRPELENNKVLFYKDETLSFTMPVPEMQDSSINEKSGLPNRSLDVQYELIQKEENTFELKVIPDQEWLNDSSRKYPIYLDPTLVRNVGLDTFVSSKYPTSNMNKFWSSSRGEYVLWIGYYDATTGTNYGLIKFPALTDLRGATISSAEVKTFVTWSYYATSPNGLWLDRVNENWSETGVTWDTRPSSTNLLSTNVARDQWANFDVTSFVDQVADGRRTDYGFKFHTNGNGTTHWKQISASENSSNRTNLSVSYSYPKMSAITTEGFLTTPTASTGYINVNWPAMTGATGYQLQMFDGKGWQTIYTGTSRSFTTKDKKIFPKTTQYGEKDSTTGGIKFRGGDGQDLLVDPSAFFNASSGTTTNTLSYQFRVIADYKLGKGSASSIAKRSIQELIPDTPTGLNISINDTTADDKAQFVLDWDVSEHATSYDVYAFNGFAYELIDNVKETSWSPNGKRLFPTSQQINNMTINTKTAFRKGDGQDFPGDPRPLYSKNNPTHPTYPKVLHYYFRVYAKSSKGQSGASSVITMNVPAPRVTAEAVGYSDNLKNNTGFLFANWKPVPGASGYNVYLYNGKEYDLVETLPADTTSWHTRNKKLWPLENQSYKLNINGVVGNGGELPDDPRPNYLLSGGKYGDEKNYWIRVTAHRRAIQSNVLLSSNFVSEGNLLRTLPTTPTIKVIKDTSEEDVAADDSSLGIEEFYPMMETSIGSFNVLEGNQFFEQTDEVLPGRGPEVAATRYFNSASTRLGMFGLGWHSGLERRLEIPKDADKNVIRYVDADGSGHLFLRTQSADGVVRLLPPTGVDYDFLIDDVNNEYVIQLSDGQREVYNQDGRLIAMEYDAKDPNKKNRIRFDYETSGETTRLKAIYSASDSGMTSPNRIEFTYNEKGWVNEMTATASSNDKVESRTYRYTYDAWDRLVSVDGLKGESPTRSYGYEYDTAVSVIEETGEVTARDATASMIKRLILPGHTTEDKNEIVATFDGKSVSTVRETDDTLVSYKKNVSEEEITIETYKLNDDKQAADTPLIFVFDRFGHLTKESSNGKNTVYEWMDHRITKVTHPDGSTESTNYTTRDTADIDDTKELDGTVLTEKDATSFTTYEYAKNSDDLLRIEDEFGLAEEIAYNEDREEVVNHEESEERIGLTEYDALGNVVREGIGLTPGVNLYANGGFESSETVSPGTIVMNGRNGKALQLNSATFSREVNIKGGHPYNLGIDMKTTGTAKGSVTLTLLNSSNLSVGSYVIRAMDNLNEWTRRFVEFKAPPEAVKARINVTSESGTTLFDEVQLDTAKDGHAVSASTFNHVEQGGFDGVNKWQLSKAVTSVTGYMSGSGLNLLAGGSAKQTVIVNQSIAKPFYVSALAQKATKDILLHVTATYEDGSTVQKTTSFNNLHVEEKVTVPWQRQSVQLTSETNQKLNKIDITIQNNSGEGVLIDAVRASVGRVVSEASYDRQGNYVLQNTGLTKSPVNYSVDAFGNILSVKQGSHLRENTYDVRGRLQSTLAENGTSISYKYNDKDEVTSKTFDATVTKYEYENGRITSVTRPGERTYKYEYEDFTNHLTGITLPSGKGAVNVYDGEGNIIEVKEKTGVEAAEAVSRFNYTYDQSTGKLTTISIGINDSKQKHYEYDLGKPDSNDKNGGGIGTGRLKGITDYHGVIQNWVYEGEGTTRTEILSSIKLGNTIREFEYDVAMRNDAVKVGEKKWEFRHNENGKVTQIKMPEQAGESLFGFDETGAVSAWTASAGEKQIAYERYTYDEYGNLTQLDKDGRTALYSYDAMDQLVEEQTLDGQTITYKYDARANRINVDDKLAEFDISNRLTKFDGQGITYDQDGNRIEDGRLAYTWDALGNLTAIQETGGTKAWQFTYDEQGRRIEKTGPSGTIRFHYDGDSNRLLAETDAQGNYIREYVYGANHLLVGLKVDGSWYNYHRNYRGDIVAITDETGTLAAEYTYDSWGKPVTKNVNDEKINDQPIRYASYYYDEDLKLYYLMARYYHPEHAVFLSVDSILDSDESIEMANGYSYVTNNPIIRIDSTGLVQQDIKTSYGGGANLPKKTDTNNKVIKTIKNLFGSSKNMRGRSNVSNNAFGSLNTRNIPNMSKQQILNKLPSGWRYTENNGFVHVRDTSGRIRMRIDPPDKVTKYHHVHLYNQNYQPLNIHLKVVNPSSKAAHIPYRR